MSGDATFPVAPRLARASVDPEKSEATSTVVAPAGGLMFDGAGVDARHRGRARPDIVGVSYASLKTNVWA